MGHIYDTVYSRGDGYSTDNPMAIRLYPNEALEDYTVESGGIVSTTLRDMCDTIYDNTPVDYYRIAMLDVSEYNRPGIGSSQTNSADCFNDWLTGSGCSDANSNNTGENLKSYVGCHLLVHRDECSLDYAGGEGGADSCGGSGGSAFDVGRSSFTPVTCSDAKNKCSARQEVLHQFIRYKDTDPPVYDLTNGDGSDHLREHALGEIRNEKVTPMLTYHVDNDFGTNYVGVGDCDGDGTTRSGWNPTLTSCTIEAVNRTVQDQC